MNADAHQLQLIANKALEYVTDGAAIGLGSGHAAEAFIRALGERVGAGFQVRGVPTSQASAHLARMVGVPLTTLDECPALDLAFDGADEVDPAGAMIKGYGGALVREKIVASSARRFIVLVGPEKLVPQLGSHGKLPIEIVPFARALCVRALAAIGHAPEVRQHSCEPFVTDNGNLILDWPVLPLTDPVALEQRLLAIPGVVGTGLFLNMNPTVITLEGNAARVLSFGAEGAGAATG
jgi:ribose 5-phosphate isomerase A